MKSRLVVLLLGLSSCLNFDARLESCRDAGLWVCRNGNLADGGTDAGTDQGIDAGSDAGADGGAPDAGRGDGGVQQLICNGGWCWENPRPTGVTLESVWGSGPDDLWVGGTFGTLMHFDGAIWTSFEQDRRLDFTSICAHDGALYFGAGTNGVGAINRLLRFDGAWSEISGTRFDINQLACGDSALWMAHYQGAARMSWGSLGVTPLFALGENCLGIAEVDGGECVVGCKSTTGTPVVRFRRPDAGLEFELVDTGGTRGSSFGVRQLWTDPSLGVLAGITGSRGEIWRRDTAWGPAWLSTTANNEDIYAGAPFASGSVAVGAGVVVLLSDAGSSDQRVDTAGNSYHRGVATSPTGQAWMVSDRGCVHELVAGAWVARTSCGLDFEDFATVPGIYAITATALYQRGSGGWDFVRTLEPDQVALWENPDGGGFAHLSATHLFRDQAQLATVLVDPTRMYVVSESRVVIAQDNGLLIDTNLLNGAATAFDAGARIGSLTGEADGTVWAAGAQGTVFHSTSPTDWSREDTGITADISDFETGFGRQWALSGSVVATRALDGGWTRNSFTAAGPFVHVVPLDAEHALLLGSTESALKVSASFELQQLTPPPAGLKGHWLVHDGEVWALTWPEGGLLRFPLPP